ncbi:5-formyltetrahydrofolate cyclo-ligase [Paenisporosarcina indica]|uniref:5-formyltetrahydrofolate cyclo-ligase n=1 Tax=Paenisporosarcina indica TaxID=650093 RepID=UPI00095009B2|nr:5-formyltetrahydrofolate cyclo-ligase [Paenisporosarcina indica]
MEKSTLRKKMIHTLNNMDPQKHQLKSNQIKSNLLIEENVKKSEVIGITLSSFPEVETWGIVESLWVQGKSVVVPKCNPTTREMIFYKITSFDQLEVVYMKLKEPIPAVTSKVDPSEIDLLIVPGVVFDRSGYRIGFGGGYYDRYLSRYHGLTISLAFDCQVVECVPVQQFDLPVKYIMTESKRIQCAMME